MTSLAVVGYSCVGKAGKMNYKQPMIASCLLVMTLLLSGCGPGQSLGPTRTPTLTAVLTLTAAPTKKVVSGPEVNTAWGTYAITRVVHATRIPPDCDPSVANSCSVKAAPGYHILIVYLELTLPGAAQAKAGSMIQSGAYVAGNDGSQSGVVANGVLPLGEFVAFEIPAAAVSFKLYWPENPPINLNQ